MLIMNYDNEVNNRKIYVSSGLKAQVSHSFYFLCQIMLNKPYDFIGLKFTQGSRNPFIGIKTKQNLIWHLSIE